MRLQFITNLNIYKLMKTRLFAIISFLFLALCSYASDTPQMKTSASDYNFSELSTVWYDGIPLGNGTVGELLWKKDNSLRFALDRIDLWDLHPVDSLSGPNYRFSWVADHIRKNDYRPVQLKFDVPYNAEPTPCKIPGAAMEFPLKELGAPTSIKLILYNAMCVINWKNGTQLQTFVHATEPVGYFVFKNLKVDFKPKLIVPIYQKSAEKVKMNGPEVGQKPQSLGYEQGKITETNNKIIYHQVGWNGFYYDVAICWKKVGDNLYGTWSITSSFTKDKAESKALIALNKGFDKNYSEHMVYWKKYWNMSSVSIPDAKLQSFYQKQMYLFGSSSRKDSYPINLQSVWTADDGLLPAWKGDYHHDMNSEVCYWPTFKSNHLDEGMALINTLWKERDVYKKYTRTYFQKEGLNVPGVMTLAGEPMGGWIQYAMSQTSGAWLSQYFYLHWKYTQDRKFLQERAYPFLKDVSTFLEHQTIINKDGIRTLEFSSNPEYFNNDCKAWFKDITNNDLSLIRFAFKATSELATELNKKDEAEHWTKLLNQLPFFDTTAEGSLTFAKGFPYTSYRHLDNAMAIYPLGLLDLSNGPEDERIIHATMKDIDKEGVKEWWGFTYPWYANLKARVFDGESAAKALHTYADCFCSKNTFCLNGDQSKSGMHSYTDNPFTTEGGFGFASAIQEMLIQSHTGTVKIFPAIPRDWKNVSFDKLRVIGGFLVSAKMENGKINGVKVFSEKGGKLKIDYPTIQTVDVPAGKWIDVR